MFTKNIINTISKNNKNSLLRIQFLQFSCFNSLRKTNINQFKLLFQTNKKCFTEQDSHSDFKPKPKAVITDSNVMNMIDEWVKGNDVVLFMKGVPQMPQCGFSNYVCQILKFYNVKNFKSVNILEDSILRENVKKYSSWPTYPQLYVKGNLVGIDITYILILIY